MKSIEKKKIIDLLVALILTGAFILSEFVKINLYGYEQIVKWLMIITLIVANISLMGNSWKSKWKREDWFEWVSFIFINIFLIMLIIGRANIYWRIAALVVVYTLLIIPKGSHTKKLEEIKKEAKILESAEERFEKHLNEASRQNKKYFGSKTGHIVHKVGCPIGEKIKRENRVYFSSSKEANRRGYKNCKVCMK